MSAIAIYIVATVLGLLMVLGLLIFDASLHTLSDIQILHIKSGDLHMQLSFILLSDDCVIM